jgi:hypothetical protein
MESPKVRISWNRRGLGPALSLSLFALVSPWAHAQAQPGSSDTAPKGRIEAMQFSYKGYPNCIKLTNGDVELIATTDIGPRILSYRRLPDGPNVLRESEEELAGRSGEPGWVGRGGHRLWVGPEDLTRTYAPDNAPVRWAELDNGVLLTQPADEYGIEKRMAIALAKSGPVVTITHTLMNVGNEPAEVAAWALTVMKGGGVEVIPLPAHADHPGSPRNARSPADFAASSTMVLWPYFSFTDDRWAFGDRYITLTQKKRGPTKIGLAHTPGWVAYLNDRQLFVKFISFQSQKTYPDRGVNYETFSNADMVEMESLGPLVVLAPGGDSTDHVERWSLLPYSGAAAGTPDALGEAVGAAVLAGK